MPRVLKRRVSESKYSSTRQARTDTFVSNKIRNVGFLAAVVVVVGIFFYFDVQFVSQASTEQPTPNETCMPQAKHQLHMPYNHLPVYW